MNEWIGSVLLLGGALLCLLAALGVLRLPDFFMRMHAATKAGVAGSGLVLLGVAALHGDTATWIKAALAVLFLLLTTPVAGHLIGRAGYLSGVPMWRGTREDALAGVLPRGGIDGADTPEEAPVRRVLLALAAGPHIDAAIAQSVALARRHGAELHGVAVIDVPRLQNVGPVPIGAGWHAQRMREHRIAQARRAAADVIERFESAARASGLRWSTQLEEGRPRAVLRACSDEATLLTAAAEGWFDQGVLDLRVDVASRLDLPGLRPLRVLR
ncbi:MAG: Na+/H+ antiporter subunit G [Hydrogenophaga sp.]|uniref:monovalent cation/H(+) antiporter subunit G n=1 Tax=Hydrogenophaga sp. TaxID=1904254 RepID=UPI001692B60D|nr:monovalent cation/H(+) antiporter subunit G [Hydrogenophaga sp.]NIM40299.1 Na+/H+ antiporter subunit G [Hydrogenophaga sp.]NIN25530.1 Na+/H+ antiporter subunit G [Hydrogenophaga sp.]NIN30182.1 Na+/H+ antiporter subunit G [Hydrogenophaga sp.]NIN54483.1 Na+/H+ antiporter subunit G [Hydrogenophaga sp.]NIO50356.1 Na+/H+ antiporter subunit G [Hydrogenophaga sp.]